MCGQRLQPIVRGGRLKRGFVGYEGLHFVTFVFAESETMPNKTDSIHISKADRLSELSVSDMKSSAGDIHVRPATRNLFNELLRNQEENKADAVGRSGVLGAQGVGPKMSQEDWVKKYLNELKKIPIDELRKNYPAINISNVVEMVWKIAEELALIQWEKENNTSTRSDSMNKKALPKDSGNETK